MFMVSLGFLIFFPDAPEFPQISPDAGNSQFCGLAQGILGFSALPLWFWRFPTIGCLSVPTKAQFLVQIAFTQVDARLQIEYCMKTNNLPVWDANFPVSSL
jgi:hypothetical protein